MIQRPLSPGEGVLEEVGLTTKFSVMGFEKPPQTRNTTLPSALEGPWQGPTPHSRRPLLPCSGLGVTSFMVVECQVSI